MGNDPCGVTPATTRIPCSYPNNHRLFRLGGVGICPVRCGVCVAAYIPLRQDRKQPFSLTTVDRPGGRNNLPLRNEKGGSPIPCMAIRLEFCFSRHTNVSSRSILFLISDR